jgi:hypothetical protein
VSLDTCVEDIWKPQNFSMISASQVRVLLAAVALGSEPLVILLSQKDRPFINVSTITNPRPRQRTRKIRHRPQRQLRVHPHPRPQSRPPPPRHRLPAQGRCHPRKPSRLHLFRHRWPSRHRRQPRSRYGAGKYLTSFLHLQLPI